MTLTTAYLIEQAEHALGGPLSVPVLQVVGEALEHVTSMHAWSFLKRPTVELASVAGQGYLTLPADFGEVLAVQVKGSYYANLVMTDPATFLGLESGVLNETGWAYWTLIEYASGDDGGAPATRLAVWPAPNATDADFAVMRYRAALKPSAQDDALVAAPSYMDALIVQVVRAFAQGYEESATASLDERLALIHAGPTFISAKRRDGRNQWRFGALKGGAADRGVYHNFFEGQGLPI